MSKSTDSFIDEVRISVTAGRGGDGFVSFRREKFVQRGGPDGGDGGRGASVCLTADNNLATLLDLRLRPDLKARAGEAGSKSRRHGKSGEHVVLRVPVGTMVFDAEDESEEPAPLADLSETGQRYVAARGGRGGQGNSNFATPTRQAPDFATPGKEGKSASLRLELKLLADVGLVGFPNAGKSTLIRRISAAKPRVGAYPFTTLVPSLGVVDVDDRRFVVADIPGLIEGASEGAGLGHRFLRHVERTRVLVHLLDVGRMELEGADLVADHETLRHELGNYDPELLERPEIVVFSKLDLLADRDKLQPAMNHFRERGHTVICVSGATGEGTEQLVTAMLKTLDAHAETNAARGAEA
jgi:GTP-binding protein